MKRYSMFYERHTPESAIVKMVGDNAGWFVKRCEVVDLLEQIKLGITDDENGIVRIGANAVYLLSAAIKDLEPRP